MAEYIPMGSKGWADVRAEFVDAQAGLCAICRRDLDGAEVLDHCHSSGMIRGALCSSCNTMLGWYENRRKEIESYLATASEFTAHRVHTRIAKERRTREEALRAYWQAKVLD